MTRIRPEKFVHVVYRTRRFKQMLEWYKAVFDAEVQLEDPALAFLTYDGEHHRFAFANLDVLRPDVTETEKEGLIGVDHVAYTYASLDALLENYEQLKAQLNQEGLFEAARKQPLPVHPKKIARMPEDRFQGLIHIEYPLQRYGSGSSD